MEDRNGIEGARQYLGTMRAAIGDKLINPDSLYYGRYGHLRLARECGYALSDFDEAGQREILSSSYGAIYVIGCRLRPLLSAHQWIAAMKQGAGLEC